MFSYFYFLKKKDLFLKKEHFFSLGFSQIFTRRIIIFIKRLLFFNLNLSKKIYFSGSKKPP